MISQRWFQPCRSVTSFTFFAQMLQLLWIFLLLLHTLCLFFMVSSFSSTNSLQLQFQRLNIVYFCFLPADYQMLSFKEPVPLWDCLGLILHFTCVFSLLGSSNPLSRVLPILSQNLLPAMLISPSLFSFYFFHSLLILIICEQTEQYFLLKLFSNTQLLLSFSFCLPSYTLARSRSACWLAFSCTVFLKLQAVLKRRGFQWGWLLSWDKDKGRVIMRNKFWAQNIRIIVINQKIYSFLQYQKCGIWDQRRASTEVGRQLPI